VVVGGLARLLEILPRLVERRQKDHISQQVLAHILTVSTSYLSAMS